MDRLIVLGTGQAVCLRYHNTAFALYDGDQYLLVDGGGGHEILTCFDQTGIEWQRLHYAFLSHEHTDHMLGMVWVVRYVAELINWGRYAGDFTVYSHDVAIAKLYQICNLLLKPAQFELIGRRIHMEVVRDGQKLDILGNTLIFFDIHSKKAKQFGFRLETAKGVHMVFLGDEPFSEETAPYMEPCDWMLTEAYCLDSERSRYRPAELNHSTVREASECAERFKAKNLVIWHTEDESTYGRRKELYAREAKHYYSGRIFVPDDFDVITLT